MNYLKTDIVYQIFWTLAVTIKTINYFLGKSGQKNMQ